MEENLQNIKSDYLNRINSAQSLKELDELFLALFGKNGQLTLLPKEFSKLQKEKLQKIGPLFNQVKNELALAVDKQRQKVREKGYKKLEDEKLELNNVEVKGRRGHIHPVTAFEDEIADLFAKLGFQRYGGAPHIDTDYYNFEVLNIPPNHPARDLQDSLYIAGVQKFGYSPGELLLRTHTSNAQVRIMKEFKLPIRAMIIDRGFRYENLDPRHEHTLDQFELVYIDKNVSMANLQYLSEYFLKAVFGEEIKARLKPKYYPFVEPGAGVEGLCIFCKGKGCKVCGEAGWLELAGAGMIHPNVLRNGGIDPDQYSGIAWGFGPERMAMLKYGVPDIRLFKNGDLKQLYKPEEDK